MTDDPTGVDVPTSSTRRKEAALTVFAAYVVAVAAGLSVSVDTSTGWIVHLCAVAVALALLGRATWISYRAIGAKGLVRTLATTGVGYAVLVVIGLVGGCGSWTLPPETTEADRALVAKSKLPLVVGVEEVGNAEDLVEQLRASGLFERVERMRDLTTPPHLVVRESGSGFGTNVVPIPSILTAGVVATRFRDNTAHRFVFRRPAAAGSNDGAAHAMVWCSCESDACLGWASGLLNLMPDRTRGEVKDHPRYHAVFAKAVAERIDEIRALAAQ
jgi:hypothetical protein